METRIMAEGKHVWKVDEIKYLLNTNDKMLMRSLKKLYECQTADEQAGKETSHVNGMGFNKPDSQFMTSVAEFMLARGYLTEKQKSVVRRKIMKYAKQLTRIANAS